MPDAIPYIPPFQRPAAADDGKAWIYNNVTKRFAPVSVVLTSQYTAADVLSKLLTVDGSGSGLDADLLRGVTPSAYVLTLVDDADAATARNTLGLGTLATANVPGSNTQVIHNAGGVLSGDAAFTYDATNDILSVAIAKIPVVRAVATGQPGMIRSDSVLEWQNSAGTTLYWDIRSDGVPRFFSTMQAIGGIEAYSGITFFGGQIKRFEANSPFFEPGPTRFLLRTNAAGNKGITIQTNVSSPTGNILECTDNSSNNLFVIAAGGVTTVAPRSAVTNAIQNNLTIGHNTSGTAAASFGVGIVAQLESSTTESQDAGRLTWQWATATHASRASKGQLSAYYTTTERPAITWGADSSAALLSFYDVTTPIARQVLATGAGRTVDDVITALQNLGLVKQS